MIDINKLEPGSRYEYQGKTYEVRINVRKILGVDNCDDCALIDLARRRNLVACTDILNEIFGKCDSPRTACDGHRIFIEV